MTSIKQKIAKKEAELARLKEKERKLENGQKIIIGGMMLSMAKDNSQVASKLLEWIDKEVTRKTDLDRLEGVINDLNSTVAKGGSKADLEPNRQQSDDNQVNMSQFYK